MIGSTMMCMERPGHVSGELLVGKPIVEVAAWNRSGALFGGQVPWA
jgi:hypothetical protein